MRNICYVTGTRADFGLMRSVLQLIAESEHLNLQIIATGMHLSERYGKTINEISIDGKGPAAEIPVDIDETSGAFMANNLAHMLLGCVSVFERLKPNLVLVLGDRGEMLAAALAAIHLNIPIAHIHGGERSGTVDEPVRHAISKLAHFHFVSSKDAAERLVKMGELPQHVYVTGAPGLDGIEALVVKNREELFIDFSFNPLQPLALFLYHPVLAEAEFCSEQTKILLNECLGQGLQIVALMPNSDSGSNDIRRVLEEFSDNPKVRVITHLPRPIFVSLMAACDVIVGNSSSGIIEAATFGTPVVNVGSRQNLRLRNANVIDSVIEPRSIERAIATAMRARRYPSNNLYGNGTAGKRIVELLSKLRFDHSILNKVNTY